MHKHLSPKSFLRVKIKYPSTLNNPGPAEKCRVAGRRTTGQNVAIVLILRPVGSGLAKDPAG